MKESNLVSSKLESEIGIIINIENLLYSEKKIIKSINTSVLLSINGIDFLVKLLFNWRLLLINMFIAVLTKARTVL